MKAKMPISLGFGDLDDSSWHEGVFWLWAVFMICDAFFQPIPYHAKVVI
jgi:hypothetical protein